MRHKRNRSHRLCTRAHVAQNMIARSLGELGPLDPLREEHGFLLTRFENSPGAHLFCLSIFSSNRKTF